MYSSDLEAITLLSAAAKSKEGAFNFYYTADSRIEIDNKVYINLGEDKDFDIMDSAVEFLVSEDLIHRVWADGVQHCKVSPRGYEKLTRRFE